jgi:AcrR family transcriptional regulator
MPSRPAERRSSASEETRRDILDAAEELFAERGFAAASMREIARRARTSQALLHHHFGTKANLYDAVKQRFTDRFNVERPAPRGGGGGAAALAQPLLGNQTSFRTPESI